MSSTIKLAARDGERVNAPAEGGRDGFVPVPNSIMDGLLSADLTPRQLKMALAVVRLTFGYGQPEGAELTVTAIARRAGIERGNASRAFGSLVEAGVLSAERARGGLVVRVNRPSEWALARLRVTNERGAATVSKQHDCVKTTQPCQNDTIVSKRQTQPCQNDTPNNIQVLHTNTPPISPPSEMAAADVPMTPVETDTPAVGSASGREAAPARRRGKRAKLTFVTFLAECRQLGEQAFSPDDALFAECEQVGVDLEWVRMAWLWFKQTYGEGGSRCDKRQADWRAVFRRSVREVWCRFWWVDAQGVRQLTTAGREFQMRLEAASREGAQ